MAVRFLAGLLRRDTVTTPELARFFAEHSANPHPTIRHYALKYAYSTIRLQNIYSCFPQGCCQAYVVYQGPNICHLKGRTLVGELD
jgi:hypothetical protein